MEPQVRHFLVVSSLILSFLVWLPSQKKMWRTKSSNDYHVGSFVIILWLQVSSLIVASLDHSRALQLYFAVNGLNVLATFVLILRFRRRT